MNKGRRFVDDARADAFGYVYSIHSTKRLQQNTFRWKCRVRHLNDLLSNLKNKGLLSGEITEKISVNLSEYDEVDSFSSH